MLNLRETRETSVKGGTGESRGREVRSSKFEVSGTWNPDLQVALFPPVPPVSLIR